MRRQLCAGLFGILLLAGSARAEIIGGVNFPLGNVSFADAVVSYDPGFGAALGFDNPNRALGRPDNPTFPEAVSLGDEGVLVVEFTNNLLVDQDDVEGGLDLFIFEDFLFVEPFRVEISMDNITYINLGVLSGQPTGIDIAPFINPGDQFRYVRLTDADGDQSPWPIAGADINAVGAIGTIRVDDPHDCPSVPEPSAIYLGSICLAALVGCSYLHNKRRVPAVAVA